METVELTVEVERSDCLVTNLVYQKIAGASVGRLVIGSETSLHKVDSETLLDFITEFRKIAKSVRQISKETAWVETESCTACKFFATINMPIIGSRTVDQEKVVFRLMAQSKKAADRLVREMQDVGLKPRVLDVTSSESMEVTDREKEVLLFAFNHGYFEQDRGASLTELAQGLEVSPSSLSDVMRRALRKIVMEYLKNNT